MIIFELLSISIKDNMENQIYAFKNIMIKLVRYIGIGLPNNYEEKVLFDIISNYNDMVIEPEFMKIIFSLMKRLYVNLIITLGFRL